MHPGVVPAAARVARTRARKRPDDRSETGPETGAACGCTLVVPRIPRRAQLQGEKAPLRGGGRADSSALAISSRDRATLPQRVSGAHEPSGLVGGRGRRAPSATRGPRRRTMRGANARGGATRRAVARTSSPVSGDAELAAAARRRFSNLSPKSRCSSSASRRGAGAARISVGGAHARASAPRAAPPCWGSCRRQRCAEIGGDARPPRVARAPSARPQPDAGAPRQMRARRWRRPPSARRWRDRAATGRAAPSSSPQRRPRSAPGPSDGGGARPRYRRGTDSVRARAVRARANSRPRTARLFERARRPRPPARGVARGSTSRTASCARRRARPRRARAAARRRSVGVFTAARLAGGAAPRLVVERRHLVGSSNGDADRRERSATPVIRRRSRDSAAAGVDGGGARICRGCARSASTRRSRFLRTTTCSTA